MCGKHCWMRSLPATCSAYAAMVQEFDIDTERLPLGTLSKDQVQMGYDVLERLRSALNGSGDSLERLSSEFYQVPGATLPSLACCLAARAHVEIRLCMHAMSNRAVPCPRQVSKLPCASLPQDAWNSAIWIIYLHVDIFTHVNLHVCVSPHTLPLPGLHAFL